MLNEALRYREMGWSVIPIPQGSKVPEISWKEFQTRLATSEEIIHWWKEKPSANVGIVTGQISRLGVVDLEYAGLEVARNLKLYSPVTSMTGKGNHLYYQWSEGLRNGAKIQNVKGLDVRGDGGYVLAPPSLHPEGRRYWWLGAVNPTLLPPFPQSILDMIGKSSSGTKLTGKGNPRGWISQALEEMSSGNRDTTFIRVLGKLHREHWTADDMRLLLQPHADRVGFPRAELERKIQSVQRYEHEPEKQTGQVKVHTSASSYQEYLERQKVRTGKPEYTLGFSKLDGTIKGLLRQELMVVAARPGVSKTNFSISASHHLNAVCNKKVLYFITEMPFSEIWNRYRVYCQSEEEFKDAIAEKFTVIEGRPTDVSTVKKMIDNHKPDFFVFDHINFISEDRTEISGYMKGLKSAAFENNIPGIVLAQLNRTADWEDYKTHEKVTPRMSMLKGSGALEEDAAQVLLLAQEENTPEQKEIIGVLDKNRYQETAIINFLLKKNPYRFVETV